VGEFDLLPGCDWELPTLDLDLLLPSVEVKVELKPVYDVWGTTLPPTLPVDDFLCRGMELEL